MRAQPCVSSACGGSLGTADADGVGEASTEADGSTEEVGSDVVGLGSREASDDEGLGDADAAAPSAGPPFTRISSNAVTMIAKSATTAMMATFIGSRNQGRAGLGFGRWD